MVPDERDARVEIDRLLNAAGWSVQDLDKANIHASRGVAIREFRLKSGHGKADYGLMRLVSGEHRDASLPAAPDAP